MLCSALSRNCPAAWVHSLRHCRQALALVQSCIPLGCLHPPAEYLHPSSKCLLMLHEDLHCGCRSCKRVARARHFEEKLNQYLGSCRHHAAIEHVLSGPQVDELWAHSCERELVCCCRHIEAGLRLWSTCYVASTTQKMSDAYQEPLLLTESGRNRSSKSGVSPSLPSICAMKRCWRAATWS